MDDLASGDEILPDVKIMVLGNGLIGKTQLCMQLRGEAYDKNVDSTHGITVTSASLGPDIRMHLWDFGGQELYHGTHAIFMRTRAVFLVLWTPASENRESHEVNGLTFRNHRLDYWLEMVRRLGGDQSPVLVIQTQCDRPEDEMRHAPTADSVERAFPFFKELHQSSATGRGGASLNESLTDAVRWVREQQGVIRIGAGRLRVKRRLEELRDADAKLPAPERRHRTISMDRFRAICAEEGGVSSAAALLSYLHECGLVFHKEGLFGDQIILDQGWALEAIYTVFHRKTCWKQLHALGGRFTRDLLAVIAWQNHGPDEQKLFLSMMESCGICFPLRKLPDGETEYIAPDLLPDEKEVSQELEAVWDGAEETCEYPFEFDFEYPGLVRSALSRLGREAGLSALYWKEGFCGYEKTTRSRVRMDVSAGRGESGRGIVLMLRTQGGAMQELLQRVKEWVRETAKQCGCQQWLEPKDLPMRPSSPTKEAIGENEEKKVLHFAPEPRKNITFAVSYSWAEPSVEAVDKLCAGAEQRGIHILRDTNTVKLGDRLSRFMQQLAAQDRIFVILSKKYLESPYCMYELLEIWRQCKNEEDEFRSRVRVFVLPDTPIRTPVERVRCAVYWREQYLELEDMVKKHGADLLGEADFRRFKLMQDFYHRVGDILALVADTLNPRTLDDLDSYGFD